MFNKVITQKEEKSQEPKAFESAKDWEESMEQPTEKEVRQVEEAGEIFSDFLSQLPK